MQQNLFPLIRHFSGPVTNILEKLPVTANMVTTASLLAGLSASLIIISNLPHTGLWAGVLMIVCYILDNCDGEIARLKNQCTTFGLHYDSFVDWIVHAMFFLALGYAQSAFSGEKWYLYLGWIAFTGATINYILGYILDYFDTENVTASEGSQCHPSSMLEWSIFIFRELTRADFCFIILILGFFDKVWVLLPFGAIGSQVYWLALFIKSARRFHV